MENYWDEIVKRYKEEQDKVNPGGLPEDFQLRMPDDLKNEFTSRIPDPYAGLPTTEDGGRNPEISAEDMPAPTWEAPPIESAPYEVQTSADTVKMNGDPRSLPSNLPAPDDKPAGPQWELEDDAAPAVQEVMPGEQPTIPGDDGAAKRAEEDAAALEVSDNDKARREAELAALEKRRKRQIIPEVAAGIGDAISASASAWGGNAPGGSMQRMVERHDKQLETDTKGIEQKLRNDATSDVSKQYQNLLAQMMQKDPAEVAALGLTANQIAEKIPAIEKIMQRRHDEDMKKLAIEAAKTKAEGQTTAQKAVDKQFGKDYAEYVAAGGYADTMTQLGTLEGVLTDLRNAAEGKRGSSNLTGGGLSMLPDAIRKRTFSDSMAAQQAVEQSVQRTLKKTLGGQFTEKEGELFMQRGYDPALPEEENVKKLERAINQLKLMALAKQEAIDYYEEHDTLDGFKGTFYTLKNGQMVKATKDDFLQMMRYSPDGRPNTATADAGPRTTKSGYNYTVE